MDCLFLLCMQGGLQLESGPMSAPAEHAQSMAPVTIMRVMPAACEKHFSDATSSRLRGGKELLSGNTNVSFYHKMRIPDIVGNIICCEPAFNNNLQSKGDWACLCKQWKVEHNWWRSVFFEAANALCQHEMPIFFQTRNLDGILASLSEYRSATCVQILGFVMLAGLASNECYETALQVALGPSV